VIDRFLRIRDWGDLQHYKDRDPPWIKLHRQTLMSDWWVLTDDASRLLALASMMLAAATANKIPCSMVYIQKAASLDQFPNIAPLVEIGFFEIVNESGELCGLGDCALANASKVLAQRRVEVEKSRGESEQSTASTCADGVLILDGEKEQPEPEQAAASKPKAKRVRKPSPFGQCPYRDILECLSEIGERKGWPMPHPDNISAPRLEKLRQKMRACWNKPAPYGGIRSWVAVCYLIEREPWWSASERAFMPENIFPPTKWIDKVEKALAYMARVNDPGAVDNLIARMKEIGEYDETWG